MTALDQAFIKAYIQHAGGAKGGPDKPHTPSASQEEPRSEAPPAQASSCRGGKGGEATSGAKPPEVSAASLGPRAASRSRASGKGAATPKVSGKKKISRPPPLPLVEALDEEDRQMPVGLPSRRTLEKLASAASQAGPPPPTPVPKPHFLALGRNTIPFRPKPTPTKTSMPEQTGSETESPALEGENTSGPECVLDFTSSTQKHSASEPAAPVGEKKQKLPKNPRKVTLTDLEIPREVCFFEPPSPTITLDGGQERIRIRGRPEMARPSESPRLSLFPSESRSGESCEEPSPGRMRRGSGSASRTLSTGLADEESSEEIPPQTLLRLRRPTERSTSPNSKEAISGSGAQAEMAEEPSPKPVSQQMPKPFCPHWRAPQVVWPKVCLALEAKAQSALDRVAEAIVSTGREGKKIFGFLSLRPGEGATTLLLCTARRLLSRGCGVLLADGNLIHPDLADQLSLAPQVGWEETVENGRTLEEAIIESMADKIAVLPRKASGNPASDRPGQVSPAAWPGLEQVRAFYDFILLDLGALEHFGGEKVFTGKKKGAWPVEGMVLVRNVRTKNDPKEITTLRERFHTAGIPVVGVVDNCV